MIPLHGWKAYAGATLLVGAGLGVWYFRHDLPTAVHYLAEGLAVVGLRHALARGAAPPSKDVSEMTLADVYKLTYGFGAKAARTVVDVEELMGAGNGTDKRKAAADRILADFNVVLPDWAKSIVEETALWAVDRAVAYFNAQGIFPKPLAPSATS